ncbi:MAG: TOBE domain-containing protein [Albidovulum sp.]|nr:TOBE domain-containing protein [Albidovulum sp.]MDE0305025.1 TOBE domain-containing protein [Albidovulum sp.]
MFSAEGISLAAPLKPDRGKATLGIRPEAISLADGAEAELHGTVFAIEMTGDATLVTVSVGEQQLIAKLDADCTLEPAQAVTLKTGPRRFFFEGKTGLAI